MAQRVEDIEKAEVEIALGRLTGVRIGGLYHFKGVPYAEAPVGELRFCPPESKRPWGKELDASQASVIAPQLASRLVGAMGDFTRTQSEDCLRLTIVTPGLDGHRPVIAWLHGGGFSSGSGGLDWYDGSLLAAEGKVVVVGINYRLGALGYLCAPGVSDGNLGLLDQALALRFVREHVASFGGDPDNITLMGQSAGGNSITALYAGGHVGAGVRRAILQSAALGMRPQRREDAEQIGASFLRALGVEPANAAARVAAQSAPVAAILDAQATVARARGRYGDTAPPFQLVAGGDGLPSSASLQEAAAEAMGRVDVLLGFTSDEAEAFFALDPRTCELDDAKVEALARDLYGESGTDRLRSLRLRRRGADSAALFSALATDETFVRPGLELGERLAAQGGKVWVYDFGWRPQTGKLGSCHCLELPFVFGPTEAWKDAPMLAGADLREVAELSAAMRSAWLAFVHTGTPSAKNLPEWPRFTTDRRAAMRLDRQSDVRDLEHETA